MIHYSKIQENKSFILSDGKTIGTLERLADAYYLVEIDYVPFQIPIKDKRLVSGIIKQVYDKGLKYEARKRMLVKRLIEKSKQPKKTLS